MPGSKPVREVHSAPGERVVPEGSSAEVVQKTRSNEVSVDSGRRSSTEDLFPDNQLGSVNDKFNDTPRGLEALPEDDSESPRDAGRKSIRQPGKKVAMAHQRSMASQAAQEFAEDAMKGYDVE